MMEHPEDFEFKPLSEGLGFHPRENSNLQKRKQIENKDYYFIDDSEVTQPEPEKYETPLQRTTSVMSQPLPRKAAPVAAPAKVANLIPTMPASMTGFPESKPSTPKPQSNETKQKTVDALLKNIRTKNLPLEQKMNLPAHSALKSSPTLNKSTELKKSTQLVETPLSWAAGFLDSLLIIASSLLCMIILLTITKIDLISALSQSTEKEIYFATVALFAVVAFIYMTVHRVFLGHTPGEWAFDQRLGTDSEQFETTYIFKVMARVALNIATGFLVFPILSSLLKRDVLSDLLGLRIYQRN